ncbi:MAG: SDR family NAD(P)-dependent oxidoreductase [Mycobacteriales bacterium]
MTRYGPWALITGGSEGVGAAFARQLAEQGVSSVLVARRPEALEQTATEVRERGAQVRTVQADLTRGVEDVLRATSDLDLGLLVLNAGANSYGHDFVSGELERHAAVVELNVTAAMSLLHATGARLRARGSGGIVVVGSMAGYIGQERLSVYAAAKAFQRILTEGLWLELRPYGVHVLHLVLGLTRTPAMERAGLRLDGAADPEDVAREGLERLPHGPIHHIGGDPRTAQHLTRLPRDQAVAEHAAMLRRLYS